jgi:hypothetical protein
MLSTLAVPVSLRRLRERGNSRIPINRGITSVAEMMLSVSVVEEAQEMLNWIEQMTRRLFGIRLANLHETTAHEEQRA